MADFAMWGPKESGFRLAEQDSIANFVKLSQGQHDQALAAQEQEKALQMRREREAISKLTTPDGTGGPGAGGTISDILRDQSRQLIRLGQPIKAGQLAVQASQVDQHEQAALTSQVGAQVKQLEGQIKMADAVSQLYGGARNQRDWDVATLMFSQQFPKQKNPLLGIPFSPDNARMARESGLSQKERLHAQVEGTRAAAYAAGQTNASKNRDERTAIYRDRVKAQDALTEAKTKVVGVTSGPGRGGPARPVGAPGKKELDAATAALREVIGKAEIPPEELSVLQNDIASNAMAIARANPAMPFSAAVAKAVNTARRDHDLEFYTKKGMLSNTPAARYSKAGSSPEAPLQPPTDMKSFVVGRYYQTPKGPLRRVEGGWEAPEPQAAPRTIPAPPADDNVEEE